MVERGGQLRTEDILPDLDVKRFAGERGRHEILDGGFEGGAGAGSGGIWMRFAGREMGNFGRLRRKYGV